MRAGIDTSIRARPSCRFAGRSRFRYGSFCCAADAPRTDSANIRRRASRAARTNSPQPVTNPHATTFGPRMSRGLRRSANEKADCLRKRSSDRTAKTSGARKKNSKKRMPAAVRDTLFFSFAGRLSCRYGNGAHGPVAFAPDYTQPCASMALATFMKPAMLAPLT